MITILLTALLTALGFGISWCITAGIIYLICLCFNLTFNILIATGIWLIIILVK